MKPRWSKPDDGVVLVQNGGSIGDGNAGILARVSKDRSPCGRARIRRDQAREGRIIQREDLVSRPPLSGTAPAIV